MKSCQPGALSHLIHIASADTTENEIDTQNSNHRHTHHWIFGCTPRRFSPRHLRARIPPRECQTDSRNNRWPVNACPREAAHKKVDTFVMVVFVVFGATVLVVVVIAIEGRKCKHALSLPENTRGSREVVHDSARSSVYRILRPSLTDPSRICAAETL